MGQASAAGAADLAAVIVAVPEAEAVRVRFPAGLAAAAVVGKDPLPSGRDQSVLLLAWPVRALRPVVDAQIPRPDSRIGGDALGAPVGRRVLATGDIADV